MVKKAAPATKTAVKKTATAVTEKAAPAKKSAQEYYYAAGKRKTAIARVRLYPKGKGIVTVNDKPLNEYFKLLTSAGIITSPLKMTGTGKDFDISVRVSGGGISAQADAIRHGIARALLVFNDSLRTTLKKAGFLTRDSRIKERKKPGLKRARRAPQFSKR
jgi:small subunit ribosomal protein S9